MVLVESSRKGRKRKEEKRGEDQAFVEIIASRCGILLSV